MADNIGMDSHHNKSSDKEAFKKFAEGEGNHMAVVEIGDIGVTYKPLNKLILNYFKAIRCMVMRYYDSDKKADIYII